MSKMCLHFKFINESMCKSVLLAAPMPLLEANISDFNWGCFRVRFSDSGNVSQSDIFGVIRRSFRDLCEH